MNHSLASSLVAAAQKKSTEMGLNMNIAVSDSTGYLVAFARMDGAWLGSIDIAIKKAKTSVLFGGLSTEQLGGLVRDMNLQGIEQTSGGLTTFGGGVSVKKGGQVIGAVGISGGSAAQDHEVAEAAVKIVE